MTKSIIELEYLHHVLGFIAEGKSTRTYSLNYLRTVNGAVIAVSMFCRGGTMIDISSAFVTNPNNVSKAIRKFFLDWGPDFCWTPDQNKNREMLRVCLQRFVETVS